MEEGYNTLVSRSWEEIDAVMRLMPRQNGCVQCDTNSTLSCPTGCPEGTECSYEILLDCQSCPQSVCVASSSDSSSSSSSSGSGSTQSAGSGGPNVGAIVGGVVGGVVAVVVATYLLWRFCIKSRRALEVPQVRVQDIDAETLGEKSFDSRRNGRSSMHTVHSVASTVLTRASNIIQIAYIPGVTNRAPPPSPAVLVPPVPPIPFNFSQNGGNSNGSSPTSPYEDQHFFIPGNLRDSSYSGYSGYSDRTSYAYAPRSSIASTVYGKNVTIQSPQTGMRAKPTVVSVSVRSTDASNQAPDTPPVPSIDFDRFGRPSSAMSTFSVGSTFLSSATTAAAHSRAQVQMIKAGDVKKVIASPRQPASERLAPLSADASASDVSSSDHDGDGAAQPPPHRGSSCLDPEEASLGGAIEDATRRAAKVKSKRTSTVRGTSPFGDEHAI